MPTRSTVKFKGSKRELIKRLRDLPAVLSGRKSDVSGIGKTFRSHFTNTMFGKIHQAFYIKAAGERDEIGYKWKPLAPATLKRKTKPPRKGILRITDKLSDSLKPGGVSGQTYRKSPGQHVKNTPRGIEIGSNVLYAAPQHKRRRLWPSVQRMQPWIQEAAKKAAEEVAKELR